MKFKSDQKHREAARRWKLAHPEKQYLYGLKAILKNKYGLTVAEWKILLEVQNGKCAICGEPLSPPHVDHSHKTNKVRGLLCRSCNLGLGMFKDNPEILKSALRYIEKHTQA